MSKPRVWFWRYTTPYRWPVPNEYRDVVLCEGHVEHVTSLRGAPGVSGHSADLTALGQRIRDRVPVDHEGPILLNADEPLLPRLWDPARADGSYTQWDLLKIFDLVHELRSRAYAMNYGWPQLPLHMPGGDPEPYRAQTRKQFVACWRAGAGLPSLYDAYDDDGVGWQADVQLRRAETQAALLNDLFPGKPNAMCVHHRHGSADRFKLIDREEFWDQQIAPCLRAGLDVVWWAPLIEIYRMRPGAGGHELFKERTTEELAEVGLDWDDDPEVIREKWYQNFIDAARWIDQRRRTEGV